MLYLFIYLAIYFRHTHLLSSFWTSRGHRCRPFYPPLRFLRHSIFIEHQDSAIPLLVDFPSSVANSRSRAFRKSISAREKVPTNLYGCALGKLELTKLTYYTRLKDNPIRHPDFVVFYIGNWVAFGVGRWGPRSPPTPLTGSK